MKRLLVFSFLLLCFSCDNSGEERDDGGGTDPTDEEKTEERLETGGNAAKSGDYSAAIAAFQESLNTATKPEHISAAHTGIGFSQMRIASSNSSGLNDAYTSVQNALAQSTNSDVSNQAKSIKTLLDYAYKKNYQEAIRLGNEIMTSEPNFEFKLDAKLNIKDVVIHKALSEYATKQFEACLASIRFIDPNYPNPQKLEDDLRKKLEELVSEHN